MPKVATSIFSYIKATKTGWWRFRIAVPVSVRKAYGKLEENFPLDTKDIEEAKAKGTYWLNHFKDKFERLSNPDVINLDSGLDDNPDDYYNLLTSAFSKIHFKMDSYYRNMTPSHRLALAFSMKDEGHMKGAFKSFLTETNVLFSEYVYPDLWLRLFDNFREMAEERLRYHHIADTRDDLAAIRSHGQFEQKFMLQNMAEAKPEPFITLSQALKEFIDGNKLLQDNKDEVSKFEATVRSLIEFLGEDRAVNHVTHEEAVKFMDAMACYPVNRPRKINFNEAIKLDGERISQATLEFHLKRLSRIYRYLEFVYKARRIENVFGFEMKWIANKGRVTEKREIFKPDELTLVYDHVKQFKERAPHKFWLPMLLLFTGARDGEFANRLLKDVRPEFNIWIIDLTKASGVSRVKNVQSKRMIPVPQYLIDIGFLNYVQGLRDAGEIWLFPQFIRGGKAKKPSVQYSVMFGAMLDELGLTARTLVLHSLRHTWNTVADNLGVSHDRRVKIVGHGGQGTINQLVYTHKDLSSMKETLDMVKFKGL